MNDMKAWVLKNFGYENISFGDFEHGELKDGEIRVRVKAIGVCYRDTIDINGAYPYIKFPTIPGHEMCGEVVEVRGNTPFKEGDVVISNHRCFCYKCNECLRGHFHSCSRPLDFMWAIPGVYAEFVQAPWTGFIKVPNSLLKKYSPEELSFVYCAVGTAYRALFTRGGFQPGQYVVITGAGGGVGIHAVMLASRCGGRVIAVTTSPDKKKVLEEAGAEWIIMHNNGKFNKEVMEITGGEGAHLCIENTGSPSLEGAIRSLRKNGKLVMVGNLLVDRYSMNPGYSILNEIEIVGSRGASTNDMHQLFNLMERGIVKPLLHKTFKLSEMMEAHRYLREKKPIGRLVLIP